MTLRSMLGKSNCAGSAKKPGLRTSVMEEPNLAGAIDPGNDTLQTALPRSPATGILAPAFDGVFG
jgi:hypothetical protein